MMDWNEIKFKDFIQLQRGFDLFKSQFVEGDFPVVGATSITGYHQEFKVYGPGVVTGRTGTIGTIQYINSNFWPHQDALWVKDFKGNLPKYVYYFLKTLKLEVFNAGGAVPALNRNHLDNLNVFIPNYIGQHKIASILSAYDELIENNKQRIRLLEEMAEEIYKEWFVRLRFPGYKTAKFVDGLPEGWKWVKVEDIFKTSSGGTPSREKESDYYGGEIDWIKTGELKDTFVFDSEEKITVVGLKNSSAKMFPPDTLLMAMYGVNIGQLGISVKHSSANQAVCVFTSIKPEEYSLYYSFFFFKSIRPHLFNISMGAAQQNLSQDLIKRVNYFSPYFEIINKYDSIVKPFFEEIKILSQKNQFLQQTRDLLLPRLISGKLSVEDVKNSYNLPEISLNIAAEPKI